jgi:hypothetical protein
VKPPSQLDDQDEERVSTEIEIELEFLKRRMAVGSGIILENLENCLWACLRGLRMCSVCFGGWI